ncbi:AAA family ATPase [Natribacillus halophilus]|uniref:MoxR-like ATPase n=1 Tax=Natribacillus halophilus TaxID=549003 RepID=A0A1G8QGB2_9BACI|nr:MoxR family ATPase [Natribacillus halophilus]SDJ03802.1 MoxR-like ATPase [Natribacillus halophilus]
MKRIQRMKDALQEIIIGQDNVIDLTLVALFNGGHILLESVPGTGKTLLAKTFAQVINVDFQRIQFTPDILPSDVTELRFFHPQDQAFYLHKGPIFTNILLADEVNRATPKTQSSLLEVMQEQQVTIDGETHGIPAPFLVLATQNPVESQQGTYSLPAAQLDRFFLKIPMAYPAFEEERTLLQRHARQREHLPPPVLNADDILALQREVEGITIHRDVETYLLALVQETRTHSLLNVGVSPRGTIAWLRAAKGLAFIKGRAYVTPTDIQTIAPYAVAHRLLLSMEGYMTKSVEDILNEVLENVPVPVEEGSQR